MGERQTGYFLFSLDTELAWGYYDLDDIRSKKFSPDGSRERKSIELLLDILDEFGIVATWAITGHLFYEKCEACDICPILEWRGKHPSFEKVYETEHPLWYGADVVTTLLTRGSKHEIAFHGYTHKVFDENRMSAEEAKTEIQEWQRLSRRKGLLPQTVIFPQGQIGHLGVFRDAGFLCYRGDTVMPRIHSFPLIGKLLYHAGLTLQIVAPQVYEARIEPSGLVNLPSSQWFFEINRNVEMLLDGLNLHNLRIRRIIRGVKKAVDEKKVIHVWAHPYEFQTEKDFEELRYLFRYVSEQISQGKLQSIGMADLAQQTIEQKYESKK